ncbi:MAG: hypothetical protein R3A51_20300 [Nannocystaceae bacterium]
MPDGSDSPTRSIRMREWQTISPRSSEGSALRGIRLTERESALAEDLSRSGRLIIHELARGLEITSCSYVGRVRLGPVTITVEPKIDGDQLLALVRYAYGLRNLRLHQCLQLQRGRNALIDLLVLPTSAEVSELVRRAASFVRISAVPATWSLAGKHRHLTPRRPRWNHPPTLRHLTASWTGPPESPACRRPSPGGYAHRRSPARPLGPAPHRRHRPRIGSEPAHQHQHRARGRGLTRLTHAYGPALLLIEMLYTHQLPALDKDDAATALPGFLFDMNRFFQALLARFLGDHLTGYDVRAEAPLRGLLRYHREANPRRRRDPSPKPDFTVLHSGRPVALLDAKYRDLWTKPLPREMLYQLVLYAISQGVDGEAVILYPSTDENARDAKIEIRVPSPGGPGPGNVILRPVPLGRLLSAVTTGTPDPGQLAEALTFGRR